jgi:hypothetical protein
VNQETYTKIFMKQSDQALTDANVRTNLRKWWKNTRTKDEGGLRLTEEGLDFVQNTLNLQIYEIPFPATLDLKPQVIIFLDRFIDCPYFLTETSIIVLSERKAFELHLFSGDVQKYGLNKAMSRKKATSQND